MEIKYENLKFENEDFSKNNIRSSLATKGLPAYD